MNENRQKPLLNTIDIILFAVLLPTLFAFSFIFLQDRMLTGPIPRWFFSPIGFGMVMLFNVGWVASLKLWPLKKVELKTRIYLTLFVLTLSGSVLAWLLHVCYLMHLYQKFVG